jgi:hypothetical protein
MITNRHAFTEIPTIQHYTQMISCSGSMCSFIFKCLLVSLMDTYGQELASMQLISHVTTASHAQPWNIQDFTLLVSL